MSKSRFWAVAIAAFITLLTPAMSSGQPKIVGISIACSNDHVYTWYSDSTVSEGTSENLAAYKAPHAYSLPFGKTPEDIVEIGIAGNDHVYAWYLDGTLSSGTTTDLDKYQPRHPYRLPQGHSAANIVGIDIACSNDHVYVWYSGVLAQVSSGTSDDLDKYQQPSYFSTAGSKSPRNIVGIGIAGNDHVYAWYNDRKASSGTSSNLQKYRFQYDYIFGPGPCDISADPARIKGGIVSSVGIRGPECKSSAELIVRLIAINPVIRTSPVIPNKILTEKRLTGSNFELPVTYACTGAGQLSVLTEVESLGRIVKSKETPIPDCF